MTFTVVGASQSCAEPEVADMKGVGTVVIRYGTAWADGAYAIHLPATRVMATLRPTEQGYVARSADLNALGYGESPLGALDDLADSIQQYLEFIRDDRPRLAPAISHHADYLPLLGVPRGSWFAWVSMSDAAAVE
jgi:hypothetical protein